MPVAVVTGASRGLGRALAEELAGSGWRLVVDARNAGPLEEVARQLEAGGAVVRAVAGDVTDPAHRRLLVEEAAALGSLDLLVHNAGALGPSPLPRLEALSPEALATMAVTNVAAPLALVQEALPLLRARRGTVVAVTSDAAVEGYEGWGAYGATKAALEQLHRVLATEEPDLRVVVFDPGDMRTRMHQEAFPGEDISDRPEPSVAAAALRRLVEGDAPGGRYRAGDLASPATPAEVPA
ncbi:MAG: SDR family NAD(P)-dependent oxidoreductase [Acidobacteriota bacterium]|nr:SDR family NAD(P)-dependent oxidoreductase [Acidobacteriota bacterium]